MDNKLLIEAIRHLSEISKGINSPLGLIISSITFIFTAITAVAALYTVRQTRELEKDRELPVIIPIGSNNLSENSTECSFTVKNIGRGVAKDFFIYINTYKVKVYGGNFNIEVGKEAIFVSPDHIDQIKELFKKKPPEIKVEFNYKDIHERNFKTFNMKLTLTDGAYGLDIRQWKFVRASKGNECPCD